MNSKYGSFHLLQLNYRFEFLLATKNISSANHYLHFYPLAFSLKMIKDIEFYRPSAVITYCRFKEEL